ncbi:MAG TPA: rod shape-determining protein MreC [Streptosporangiaceae bacterium]|nr:rod shape-determining protein MreC [Streptosporangiaceae bacterium]
MHDSRRTRLILGVLIAAALGLIILDYSGGGSGMFGGIRRVSASVFGSAEHLVSSTSHVFTGSGSGASGSQVQALRTENIKLRTELSQARLSKSDYSQLQRLLSVAGKGGYRIVAATVIANGQGYQQTVTLDAGSRDGVKPRETVLNGQGLVGEVTSVGPDTCTVLLATDSSSTVGVQLAPGGQIGWVTGPGKTGTGTGHLSLQVLDASAVLGSGDQLVTSASVHDRPFVPGVPVGYISSVSSRAGALTARAVVTPYVDFTALGVVGIVVEAPRHNPRFSVLPPKPHVKPTPTVTVTVTPGSTASPGTSGTVSPTPGG